MPSGKRAKPVGKQPVKLFKTIGMKQLSLDDQQLAYLLDALDNKIATKDSKAALPGFAPLTIDQQKHLRYLLVGFINQNPGNIREGMPYVDPTTPWFWKGR